MRSKPVESEDKRSGSENCEGAAAACDELDNEMSLQEISEGEG